MKLCIEGMSQEEIATKNINFDSIFKKKKGIPFIIIILLTGVTCVCKEGRQN